MEFVDIAGLVKGASKGEGLGNKFLGNIREVDAVVHVVRCFDDPDVVHVDGSIGPKRDMEVIDTELMMADLDSVERRIHKRTKDAKRGDKEAKAELDLLGKLKPMLDEGRPLRTGVYTAEENALLKGMFLLTAKPVLYLANVDEGGVSGDNAYVSEVREVADKEGAKVVVICGKTESEIASLPVEDRPDFLAELGLTESGLDRLAKAGYEMLGLINYFTVGEDECRAWTITRGTKAPGAAGKIHTDFEHGFIRAEVVGYEDLLTLGSWNAAKDKGLLRSEGKEYVVRDGDCILFRFNV
jgi:hypothetical protein